MTFQVRYHMPGCNDLNQTLLMPWESANEPIPAPISSNFEADSYKSNLLLER